MRKTFSGYVEIDPEYNYIGVGSIDVGEVINRELQQYEGETVRLSIVIESVTTEDDA